MVAPTPTSLLAARAHAAYETVRAKLESAHSGEFVVFNLDTNEYEVGPDDLAVSRRAKLRFPNVPLFAMRVGRRTAYRLGFRTAASGA
ncbi:MAG: hypothetical protein CHACPFDD_02663 [Phycisphaerae bacterium]|nr:hypothetical protein [Phycisphaerae bacterium]